MDRDPKKDFHPDPEKLRELAEGWRKQATLLDSIRKTMVDEVGLIDWKGYGREAAVSAAAAVSGQVSKVVDATNKRAQAIEDAADDLEKALKAQALAEIIGAAFAIGGLILGVVLYPAVAFLGRILAGLVAGFVGGEIATAIGLFTSGFIVYGALSLALDFGALGIIDKVTGIGFHPTWADGVNVGLGALLGGLFTAPMASGAGRGGSAAPKTSPLMDKIGLGLGEKPPDVQIINHVTGDVSTITFTPRPVGTAKFGPGSIAGGSKAAPKFDATITRTTADHVALTQPPRPTGGTDGSIVERPGVGVVPRPPVAPTADTGTVPPRINPATRFPDVAAPETPAGGPGRPLPTDVTASGPANRPPLVRPPGETPSATEVPRLTGPGTVRPNLPSDDLSASSTAAFRPGSVGGSALEATRLPPLRPVGEPEPPGAAPRSGPSVVEPTLLHANLAPGGRPRLLGPDSFPETPTFGLRPLEHIPEGAPARPVDAVSAQADAGSVAGSIASVGPRLGELPPLPPGGRDVTFVSVDGGRTWAQAPGSTSVANFDRILGQLSHAGRDRDGTPLSLTVARQIRWNDPVEGPQVRTEFYVHDAFGWKTAPPGEAVSMFPGGVRTGPEGYRGLVDRPQQLTDSTPLTWDALARHDALSAGPSDPAGRAQVPRWLEDVGHSSPPAADRTPGGLEMYGGQAGEHAESMVLPLDPHGPRTALPTNAGRYYVSLDGGAHWTLFNTAGESAASIQRGLATILQGADRPGGGGPRDVVVATVTRGLDADTQTTFHLGPHGWRTGETGRIASPDDLPPAPRTIEVLSPAVTDRGFASERWTEVRRWTEPTPGRPGESSVPVSRQVAARDVEEELGYAPGGPGGRTEGYFVRTTELEGTPTDVRLFRNDGRGWEQVTADDLPHLNRDADPFGGGDGHAALLGNRDATGLSAQQLGRVTADAELQESSAAFSQRRGLEWLEQARTAGPPPESRVVPVFRVEVPDLPVPSEAALLGGGKFGAEPETLGSWLAGLLERYGLTGVRKDDPHLPSYESVAADAPPRMVDGLDYGLFKPLDHDVFKSKAPERFDPRATLGGGKNAPDAIIAEIDRIMAERRFLAETGTGGEARPTTDPPRSAGDEVSVPPAQPSLRSQAIDAMARHEEMVEYSQSGLRPSAGGEVPSGSVAGGGGRPYGTIRDELIAAGNKPGLPPRAAQESYARNLSLGELRAGLEGVVHERRDLLVAQASGRPYDIVGTTAGKAGASPDADQVAALTSTRLQQLDGVEAALYRAWESRLGASPPAVRTPPSTQAEGRAAVEAELARLVQLRRQEFSPRRPAGADAVDSDLLASIVEAESALLQKTRGIEEQALQANVTSATSDLAAAARALTDVVARFKAAGGRAHVGGGEGQVVSQVKQAAERFDELTLEAYRAHLAVQSAQEQLSGVFGPPSWAVAAGTISAPDASVVTYHDAAVSKAPMSFGERARTLLAGALASAAGSNSLVPVGSGYVLRGPGPDGATPPPLTDEDLRAAQLAPAINGAVRIMPDVRALAGLEKVVRSLPPWLKYRVVPDLRLIPVDADLPFSPKSFAARNFVHVDVPVRAVKAPDPARGFPVGLNGQRTIGAFGSGYRWAPSSLHVPAPPKDFLPRPTNRPFNPSPLGRRDHTPTWSTGTAAEEPRSFDLAADWTATRTGGSFWLHPRGYTTTPAAVANSSSGDKVFIGAAGLRTPAPVWRTLHTLVDRLTPDAAARLSFDALGTATPPVPSAPAEQLHASTTLRSAQDLRDKVAELERQVLPEPTEDKIAQALQALVTYAWGARGDGMPVPTSRVGATSEEHLTGEFRYQPWDIVMSPPSPDALARWTRDDWHDFAALGAHELGHAGQFTKIARYLAAENDTVDKLRKVLPTQKTEVLKAALDHPFAPGTPEYGEGRDLYESIMGPGHQRVADLNEKISQVREQVMRIDTVQQLMRGVAPQDARYHAAIALAGLQLREDHAHYLAEYKKLPHETPAYQIQAAVSATSGLTSVGQIPSLTVDVESVRPAPAVGHVAGLPPVPGVEPPARQAGSGGPQVAELPGAAGAWLTRDFRDALSALSGTGDSTVGELAARWDAEVTAAGKNPDPAVLDRMLSLVDTARARATLATVGDAATAADAPTSAEPWADVPEAAPPDPATAAVVRDWLAQHTWAQSADYFAEHESVLVSADAKASLQAMLAADPDSGRLSVHAGLLALAVHGQGESAYSYLTRPDRADRKQVMLDLARQGTGAAAFTAMGRLPDGVDPRFSPQVSFSERAYGKLAQSIAMVFGGDTAGAIDLATQARRHLTGPARFDWVMVLDGLAASRPEFESGLKAVQLAIVDCD